MAVPGDDHTDGDVLEHGAGFADMVTPALLEAARTTYGLAIRRALRDAGFEDVPRRGMGLVGGIARNGPAAQQDLVRFLNVSKQAASQLVDALAERGYVQRAADEADRRRVVLTLTERGRQAADISAAAVTAVDRAVARRCSEEEMAAMRRVVATMIGIGEQAPGRRAAAGAPTA